MKKVNELLKYRSVNFLIYFLFVFIANILMFMGKDMMKWDIMDCHYPNSMFLSNALHEGILPLWNPLFYYGLPHYANIGMPIYYPTTILFASLGYRLWMVAAEYSLHLIIACYGMNRYVAFVGREKQDDFLMQYVALILGALYGFSGVFISNAQHIMIIISAAWLPYVFLYVRKYFELKKNKYLVYAATFSGLSVWGGYPEIWIGMIILLVPYMMMCSYGSTFWHKIKKVLVSYVIYGILTLCASAIVIVPTLNVMPYMGRLNGSTTVDVCSYELYLFLSAIIPNFGLFLEERPIDISMICGYMGLITIAIIPNIIMKKKDEKNIYLIGMSIFSALMMLGENTPLHLFFQKYFPMFSSLRFPSLYRCFLCLFTLELSHEVWYEILARDRKQLKILARTIMVITVSLLLIICSLEKIMGMNIFDNSHSSSIYRSVLIILFIYVTMLGIIFCCMQERINKNISCYLIVSLIFIEVFCIYRTESPTTVGYTDFKSALSVEGEELENTIKWFKTRNEERLYSVDYKNSVRSSEDSNARDIVTGNVLSEKGYAQVKLDSVNRYKETANRQIIQDNPIFYFTQDVVDGEEVVLEEWLNDWSVDKRQIYVEKKMGKLDIDVKKKTGFFADGENIEVHEFTPNKIVLRTEKQEDAYLVTLQSYYPGWKCFVDGNEHEILKVNGAFRGIFLNGGIHEVEFIFQPWDFYVGLCITGIFYLIIVLDYIKEKKMLKNI